MYSKIVAQQISPNAMPARSSKTGSSVKKIQSQEKTNSGKTASSSESKIPACVQASPCYVIEQPQAKTETQKANDESLDRLYRRSLRASVFGVIGAFVGLVVLIWQTILTRRAANAAKSSADSTAKQTETLILGQRAYLLPESGSRKKDKDGNLKLEVTFLNSGETPALKCRPRLVEGIAHIRNTDFPVPDDPEGRRSTSFIGANQPLYIFRDAMQPNPQELAAINNGTHAVYISGDITYEDIFGKPHTTRFRLVSEGTDFPAGIFVFCDEGNEIT